MVCMKKKERRRGGDDCSSAWKSLARRMAEHLGCHTSEVVKRKRPGCSAKLRRVAMTSNELGWWASKSASSWHALVLEMCKTECFDPGKRNLFYHAVCGGDATEADIIALELLGFSDFIAKIKTLKREVGAV